MNVFCAYTVRLRLFNIEVTYRTKMREDESWFGKPSNMVQHLCARAPY